MKKSILLLFAALLPLVASAEKVEIDGIWYNLITKGKVAEVTSSDGTVYSGSITIPATVTHNGVAYSVTSIGEWAFGSCYSLTDITIPEGVTSIGVEAFYNCESLTSITLPESVTSIGEGAFYGCSNLTAINISSLEVWCNIDFASSSANPLYYAKNLYLNGGLVTELTIPNSVTAIKNYAFYGWSSLTSITLPEDSKLTSIGDYAFYDCSDLKIITIPEGVTSIGSYAFSYCSSLTAITIPESVTSIGNRAFFGYSSLTDVYISSIEAWCKISLGDYLSNPLYYAHNLYLNGELVTELVIPGGVTSIRDYAFYKCSSLTAITIPESVTSIGNYAFFNCSSLTTITIPEDSKLTSIEKNAFYGCSSLTDITLPKSVIRIYSKAFANCPELTDVYCYAESVPSTNADAFDGSYPEYATLHVPAGAINSYKTTAPWSGFGTFETVENVTLEKCATPVISYVDGKVVFACDTEGAIVKSNFKDNNASDYSDSEVLFIPTYTLTAYATKEKYEDSDVATLTLCWVPCDENHEESDGILAIPSKPVLISARDGVLTLSGLAEGTEVTLYTTDGAMVAHQQSSAGEAKFTVDTNQVYLVHIGGKVVKIGM